MKFPSITTHEKEILELIHGDVFVPIHVPSLGVYLYYISLIDYFTRNMWLYFLKNKSKVSSKLKKFKALVEKEIGKKIILLGTNNQCEFFGKGFEQFRVQCAIAQQNTTLYTLQQNGFS